MAVTAADYPLPPRGLTLERLAEHPLIVPRPGTPTRERVLARLEPLGGQVSIEVDSPAATLRFATAGLGVAFVGLLPGQPLADPGIAAYDVTRLFAPGRLFAVWRRNVSLGEPQAWLLDRLSARLAG